MSRLIYSYSQELLLTTSYTEDGKRFEFRSYRHTLSEQEALISYGDRSSQDLMRDYGFVCEGNHSDRLFSDRERANLIPPLYEEAFLEFVGINPQSLKVPGRLNASAWLKDFAEPIERGRIEAVCRSLQLGPRDPKSAATVNAQQSSGFRWPWVRVCTSFPRSPMFSFWLHGLY